MAVVVCERSILELLRKGPRGENGGELEELGGREEERREVGTGGGSSTRIVPQRIRRVKLLSQRWFGYTQQVGEGDATDPLLVATGSGSEDKRTWAMVGAGRVLDEQRAVDGGC